LPTVLRRALLAVAAATVVGVGAPAADARTVDAGKPLEWQPCETAPGWECATATVPKVYGGHAGTFKLAVTRLPAADQAHKVGSLFINYGGPGASAVDITQAIGAALFAPFHERFDLVAFDPRGTGATSQAIDCHANQETQGVYSHRSSSSATTPTRSSSACRATGTGARRSIRTSCRTRRPATTPGT
jgi:pimeloyl-ACP methyl ester carboxylesterase